MWIRGIGENRRIGDALDQSGAEQRSRDSENDVVLLDCRSSKSG